MIEAYSIGGATSTRQSSDYKTETFKCFLDDSFDMYIKLEATINMNSEIHYIVNLLEMGTVTGCVQELNAIQFVACFVGHGKHTPFIFTQSQRVNVAPLVDSIVSILKPLAAIFIVDHTANFCIVSIKGFESANHGRQVINVNDEKQGSQVLILAERLMMVEIQEQWHH